jgi:Na+/proline symporter
VFFGALLSVIMSTASGTLLAPAVTFSENVLRGFLPRMTDRQMLLATRGSVTVFSLVVLSYALSTGDSIHQMVENAYRITLAGAFVPLVAGLFWRRANNLGAGLSVGLGLGVWLVAEMLVPDGIVEPHLYGLGASAVGMLIGGVVGAPGQYAAPAGHQATDQAVDLG